jgi:uncharacterized protein with NRDE domain
MCILMVVYKLVKDFPIILAANRDEYLDRPTQGPCLLTQVPQVWGGRDERGGGTWLGINAYGLVVGLTNRRRSDGSANDPTRRSRGLLCLAALQCRSPAEVVDILTREPVERYNPFNLLIVDQEEAVWIAYEDIPKMHRIESGLHILANGDVNDFETVRIRRARHLLLHNVDTKLHTLLPYLEQVCKDHESGGEEQENICMHRPTENYGTVSSTILALSSDLGSSVYRYADGHPCTTPYTEYKLPFSSVS